MASLLDSSFGPYGKDVTITIVAEGVHYDKLKTCVIEDKGDTIRLNDDGKAVLQYTRKRMDAGSWNVDETILYELDLVMEDLGIPKREWKVDWDSSKLG